MDRLSLAEAALAAASRAGGVVVPDRVTSPMDSCQTVPVPRAVVQGCSDRARHDADAPDVVEAAPGDVEPGSAAVLDPEMARLAAGDPPAEAEGRSA